MKYYVKLYQFAPERQNLRAPVVITEGSLLQDPQAGTVLAELGIAGGALGSLRSLTVRFLYGEGRFFGYRYEALDALGRLAADAGAAMVLPPVALPDPAIRSFRAELVEASFTDGSSWRPEYAPEKPRRRLPAVLGAAAAAVVLLIAGIAIGSGGDKGQVPETQTRPSATTQAPEAETPAQTTPQQGQYARAMELEEAGSYREARAEYEALGGYEDSPQRALDCGYQAALELQEKGDLSAAAALFAELGGYRDSREQAAALEEKIAMEALLEPIRCAAIGDVVPFGAYEQNNYQPDGQEDILWIVLARTDDSALLLSKYCLEMGAYHSQVTPTTWEDSDIRSWLNGEFLKEAFSGAEAEYILETKLDNNDGCPDTRDRLFLLSEEQVENHFGSFDARKAMASDYTEGLGLWTQGGVAWWWLRSSRKGENGACYVYYDGGTYIANISYEGGIRPAFWIDLG